MGCCKCEEYGWKDSQEVIAQDDEGNEYCLFHAPAKLKENRHEELMDAVWERINCVVERNIGLPEHSHTWCNLRGTVFGENAPFPGVIFPPFSLRSVQFEGVADFESAQFGGEADFQNVQFGGIADFKSAQFGGEAFFFIAKFGRVANFQNVQFRERADFCFAKFGGKNAPTVFSNTTLLANETLDFSKATITGSFFADNAKFQGKVKFDHISFPSTVSFAESNLGQASFRLCTFKENPIFDRTDLRKAELIGAPIEDFRLMACKWPKSNGRTVTYDARTVENDGYFPIDNVDPLDPFPTQKVDWETTSLIPPIEHLEDLYRRLKKVARTEMDEPLASDFHYAEKEMQRLRILNLLTENAQGRGKSTPHISFSELFEAAKFWMPNLFGHYWHKQETHTPPSDLITARDIQNYFLYYLLTLYKLSSEYGEGPGRAGLVFSCLIFAPLVFFISIGWMLPNGEPISVLSVPSSNIMENWLHFLPLIKLPDANEAGWLARLLMLGSQLAITLQAALFGFALRNRFRR